VSDHDLAEMTATRAAMEVTGEMDSQPEEEEQGFELVWGFSCQVVVLVCCRFFVRSGKAVLRPVACDQVRGARGRGQGTEMLAH
jgi:hypothetical protein